MPMCQDKIFAQCIKHLLSEGPPPVLGAGSTMIEEEGTHSGEMPLQPCWSMIQRKKETLKDVNPRNIMISFAP